MLINILFNICLIIKILYSNAESGSENGSENSSVNGSKNGSVNGSENGIATFYPNIQNACQYDDNLFSNYLKVAISQSDWNNGISCGSCLTITGNGSGIGTKPFNGTYNAIVTNLCSEC